MNAEPSQTGRTIILLTPMIATSGWLMIGVVATPPSAPSEVIVMVEPDSSSRVAVPALAASARRLSSAAAAPEIARLGVPDDRHDEARRRLRGDADMDAGVLMEDARFVVEERVQVRLVGDRLAPSRASGTAAASARLGRPLLLVERGAQLLERGDVDLFDIGDVRDVGVRQRHPLGDLAAQADELDVFDRSLRCSAGRARHAAVRGEEASRS